MVEQINPKLDKIRALIKENNIDAYVVFHNDSHSSEYIAPKDERIKYISGFSGSNGICVITQENALMWTDGRYYLQAEKQLESGWKMMKWESPLYFEWLSQNLQPGNKIGVDPSQIAVASFRNRSKYFKEKNFEMVTITENLVDKVWAEDKPKPTSNKIFIHDLKYAGKAYSEKLEIVCEKLKEKKVDALLVTSLDDIAWLFNLRGNDIPYNPVFFSYCIVYNKTDEKEAHTSLYLIKENLSEEVSEYLKTNKVDVFGYDEINIRDLLVSQPALKLGFDENVCNQKLYEEFSDKEPVHCDAIIEHIKAVKNPVEMQGMRNANIKNCASLVQYFAWMEDYLNKNPDGGEMTEYTAAKKLEEFRAQRELYMGPSFDTISSIGPNGAVIHYKPKKDTSLKMNNKELYLLDSGVQYLEGTTDITRTVQFGGCDTTAEQKDRYTRVLLGVLDLERAVWPAVGPYSGADFDVLARMHLWADGVDYNHGTGHGVGTFGCVHEGPQGIYRSSQVKLQVGMCQSDEPGFYKEGEFGIRIENVIMVVNHPKFSDRLMFENLTVCPYARELIDKSLLSPVDVKYIDDFHKKCEEILTPLVEGDELALSYLKRKCAPL